MGEESLLQTALTWQGWFVVVLLVLVFIFLVKEILPADLVLLIGGCIPVILGIVPAKVFLLSFANETIVTIAALFVVVQSFEEAGILSILSRRILPNVHNRMAQLSIMLPPVSFFSAFLNNTPIVIMLTPTFRQWSLKRKLSPSKFLIPLSFATIAGGVCTLIGTSTNLVVNGLMISEAGVFLSFFEIGKIGIFCAVIILLYLIFFSRFLLPDRTDPELMISEDIKKMTTEFLVEEDSPLIDQTIQDISKKFLKGEFNVIEIERGKKRIHMPGAHEKVLKEDRLILVGEVEQIPHLHAIKGLKSISDPQFEFTQREPYYSEFVIPAGSTLAGKTLRRADFRQNYRGSVFAIFREGRNIKGNLGEILLKAGDVLMVFSSKPWDEGQMPSPRDLLPVKTQRAFPFFSPKKGIFALIVIILMIVAATLGVSMMIAALSAALILILSRTISARKVVKNINWSLLILIAGGFALSSALEYSRVAHFFAQKIFPILGDNPRMLIGGVFLLTTIVTELITNTAAVLLLFPIALETMKLFGAHTPAAVKAVGITIAIAASCSFLTPIGYQTNTIVYGPGGYRFTDYLKVGLPLNLLIWALSIALIPIIWPVR